MNILFIHDHFPGHYPHLARALAAEPGNRVVFATQEEQGAIEGVEKRLYRPARSPGAATHHYLQSTEAAVLNGQAAYRTLLRLREEGFNPDVICAHSGFGPSLYAKDVFPAARLVSYFEWFYRAYDSDADYLEGPVPADEALRIRTRNTPILLDLAQCDQGLCPTRFQAAQFPAAFRQKLRVMHDGIDTEFFKPEPSARLSLPGVELGPDSEIISYATRGMEPYRGFPQFMRAANLLLQRRPNLHIVVGGNDSVSYSRRLPNGRTYRQAMLEELSDLDQSRLHFVGYQSYPAYRQLLQATQAHIYLTVPFVLSWSILEAMSCGCAVIASDGEAVREIAAAEREVLLADFFSPDSIAEQVERVLDHPTGMADMRSAARRRVTREFDLLKLLPMHVRMIKDLAGKP